jgi:hypothetical protein
MVTIFASQFPLAHPSPDQWAFVVLLLIGVVFTVAYSTGSVAEERRRRRDAPLLPPRPLLVNRLVNIDAGPHAGLVGWVREFVRDARTGREKVTVECQDGTWVQPDREDVSALFG